MSSLPEASKYVVIGAGIHGLSTAYHLALELKARGQGSGADIIVLDKEGVGAGASGIACGVIRNNYFQPAMRELMAHSVEVWDSDPEAYSYHPVGYMQISPAVMEADVAQIYEQQKAIGYESELIVGAAESEKYMKGLFHDWRARGITSVLHEKKGGYANNMASMLGLAGKAEGVGVTIHSGVKVAGFQYTDAGITAVETDQGTIRTDYVVVGVGPWVKHIWDMLELPKTITVNDNGTVHENIPMWRYWCLQEGTLGVEPDLQRTNDGELPPGWCTSTPTRRSTPTSMAR